jgi:hypothetical protein
MRFSVTTEGPNRLGLMEVCQRFANDEWTPTHFNVEQASVFILDQFRRAVLAEIEMLTVDATPDSLDRESAAIREREQLEVENKQARTGLEHAEAELQRRIAEARAAGMTDEEIRKMLDDYDIDDRR